MNIIKQAFGISEKDEGRQKSSSVSFKLDEQFMTPDFLFKQQQEEKPTNFEKKNNNLTKSFYLSLSTLEYKYYQQPVKQIQLVDQLVGMYQECVQIYDTHMDPIKYYFLDKIKILLTQTDKFTQRETKPFNSSSPVKQKSATNIKPREVGYFKELEEGIIERIDRPTEYYTPRTEEQQIQDNKLIAQLKTLIEDGDLTNQGNREKVQKQESRKEEDKIKQMHNDIQQVPIQRVNSKGDEAQTTKIRSEGRHESHVEQLQQEVAELQKKQEIEHEQFQQKHSPQQQIIEEGLKGEERKCFDTQNQTIKDNLQCQEQSLQKRLERRRKQIQKQE